MLNKIRNKLCYIMPSIVVFVGLINVTSYLTDFVCHVFRLNSTHVVSAICYIFVVGMFIQGYNIMKEKGETF